MISSSKKIGSVVISLFAVFLGITWDNFFIPAPPGISVPIFIAFVLIGFFLLTKLFSRPLDHSTFLLSFAAFFFATMVFVRASIPLTLLNLLAILFSLLLLASHLAPKKFPQFRLGDYLKLPFLPLKFIAPFFHALGNLVVRPTESQERQILPHIVKGIFLALPFFIIFLLLFISADDAFQKFLSEIFDIHIETLGHIFRSALIAAFFLGAYAFVFLTPHPENSESEKKIFRSLGLIEGLTVLGILNALFAIFVSFQLIMLFQAGNNVPSLGITYAEYARHGFTQLIAASAITFLLLWALESTIHQKDNRHSTAFKTLSAMIVFFVALIMMSAFMRLWFYEQEYGFTHLRFYSHAFILWLAVIFIVLLYKIFINHEESHFLRRAVMSLFLFLAAINILNPEAFIVRQNYQRYLTTDRLDFYYLNDLSADAVPEMIKIRSKTSGSVQREFGREIYQMTIVRFQDDAYQDWRSYHFSRERSKRQTRPLSEELQKEYDSFIQLFGPAQ